MIDQLLVDQVDDGEQAPADDLQPPEHRQAVPPDANVRRRICAGNSTDKIGTDPRAVSNVEAKAICRAQSKRRPLIPVAGRQPGSPIFLPRSPSAARAPAAARRRRLMAYRRDAGDAAPRRERRWRASTTRWETIGAPGFVGNMTVPGGSQGLHGWTIEFDASFDISNIWGAEIVSHVGNHYVIRNLDWNADVAGGRTGELRLPGHARRRRHGGHRPRPRRCGRHPAAATAVAADALDRRRLDHRRQQRHRRSSPSRSRSRRPPRGTGDGPLLDRQRHRHGRLRLHRAHRARSPSPPARRPRRSTCRSPATPWSKPTRPSPSRCPAPSGATIADGSATGTIVNDDVAATAAADRRRRRSTTPSSATGDRASPAR